MKSLSALLLALVYVFILTACAPPPSATAPENKIIDWAQRKHNIEQFTQWDLRGGMAVKDGNKGFTARMTWQQSSVQNYRIQLIGPLGSGHVSLISQHGRVTLTDNKQKVTSQNATALLRQQTGYTVPLDHMYYWLRGLPSNGSHPRIRYDQYMHITQLQQAGWRINYARYTAYRGMDLPSKIIMQRGNIKVKVIINRWG